MSAVVIRAPWPPLLLTFSSPAAWQDDLSLQHTITSVFPPSFNHSHLQTQQHMPACDSAAELLPVGVCQVGGLASPSPTAINFLELDKN